MKKTGLSLLEIMVASIILALILTGFANIFVVGRRYTVHTRSKIQGAEIGKYFLEPLYIQVRQDEWGNNCLSSAPTVGCPVAETIDSITYTPAWDIAAVPDTTLRRVSVTVNWTEPE